MGVVTSEKHGVFSSNQCGILRNALNPAEGPPIIIKVDNNSPIFVTIDPTGGGGVFCLGLVISVCISYFFLHIRFKACNRYTGVSKGKANTRKSFVY